MSPSLGAKWKIQEKITHTINTHERYVLHTRPACCSPWDFKPRFGKNWAALYQCDGIVTAELVTFSDLLTTVMRTRGKEKDKLWGKKIGSGQSKREKNERWRDSHSSPGPAGFVFVLLLPGIVCSSFLDCCSTRISLV